MNNRDPTFAAPSAERLHLRRGVGAAKTPDWELGDRSALLDPIQPGAGPSEARHMYVPAPAIEPSDELDHLPFGPACLEARHHYCQRHWGDLLLHAAI